MPNIEVDQSGKMGDLAIHTVLALANDIEYAILIPAGVKKASAQAGSGDLPGQTEGQQTDWGAGAMDRTG